MADRQNRARDKIARFLFDLASTETGGGSWDSYSPHHPMKRKYMQAAQAVINLMPVLTAGPEAFAAVEEKDK